MGATSITTVRQALRDQIAALSGTAYAGTWKETVFPLGILEEPATRGHLAFSVVDEGSENNGHRGRDGGTIANLIRFRVSFLYQMRPSAADMMTSWDLSSDAAEDVIRALMGQSTSWSDAFWVRYRRFERVRLSDSSWLTINLFFDVEHELTV